jgi:hypothetical protein
MHEEGGDRKRQKAKVKSWWQTIVEWRISERISIKTISEKETRWTIENRQSQISLEHSPKKSVRNQNDIQHKWRNDFPNVQEEERKTTNESNECRRRFKWCYIRIQIHYTPK